MSKLGKYHLEELLGRGASGEVWKTSHPETKIPLAVKVLRFKEDENSLSSEIIARFLREAEIAASLKHPNIVKVYEVNMHKGTYFIVMEYVNGANLREQLNSRGEAFEQTQLIDICLDVINGLKAAWEKNIIHRDIKPDNIMMDEDGNVKLADLGIAKQLDSEDSLTLTGFALGTPDYISPEQALGRKDIDHRSDIYSLGATLYHLATGFTPFSGTTSIELMMKHAQEPLVHPKLKNAKLSEGFCAVICKMMEKNPCYRYQTYEQLHSDLNAVQCGASLKKLQANLSFDSLIMPKPKKLKKKANLALFLAGLCFLPLIIFICQKIFYNQESLGLQNEKQPVQKELEKDNTINNGLNLYLDSEINGINKFHLPNAFKNHESISLECRLRLNYNSNSLSSIRQTPYFAWKINFTHNYRVGEEAIANYDFGHSSIAIPNDIVLKGLIQANSKTLHLAAVCDGQNKELRFYVNGRFIGNKVFDMTASNLNLRFTYNNTPSGSPFNGYIEEARISSFARYTENFNPVFDFLSDDKTLAIFNFKEATGDTLLDSSGNNNNARVIQGEWVMLE